MNVIKKHARFQAMWYSYTITVIETEGSVISSEMLFVEEASVSVHCKFFVTDFSKKKKKKKNKDMLSFHFYLTRFPVASTIQAAYT